MEEPKKVSQKEYDEFRSRMENKYGYDDMSDEEKEDFDKKIDQIAVVDDDADETDNTDNTDDDEPIERGRDYPEKNRDDDDERVL